MIDVFTLLVLSNLRDFLWNQFNIQRYMYFKQHLFVLSNSRLLLSLSSLSFMKKQGKITPLTPPSLFPNGYTII